MKYRIFITLIFLETLILLFLFISGNETIQSRDSEILWKRKMVSTLMLTDFALWTEARYTRHPSQADLFTPFQDFPSSMEHFPAGSIMAPGNIRLPSRLEFKKRESIK